MENLEINNEINEEEVRMAEDYLQDLDFYNNKLDNFKEALHYDDDEVKVKDSYLKLLLSIPDNSFKGSALKELTHSITNDIIEKRKDIVYSTVVLESLISDVNNIIEEQGDIDIINEYIKRINECKEELINSKGELGLMMDALRKVSNL